MRHVQSVERVFALLEHMVELGGIATVSQLSRGLGVSLGGTHRRLRTLVDLGYARQLQNRSYALGPGLIRLGEGALGQHMSAMQPAIASAVSQLGETATLAMLDGDTIVHTIQVQSHHGLRSTVDIRKPTPAHETPAGRVLLAQLEDDRIKRTLARAEARHTGTSGEEYRRRTMAAIRKIQSNGYFIDDDDQHLGTRCYAVPVLGAGRPLVLSIVASVDRLGVGLDGQVITVLQQAALRSSMDSNVAWRPSPKHESDTKH